MFLPIVPRNRHIRHPRLLNRVIRLPRLLILLLLTVGLTGVAVEVAPVLIGVAAAPVGIVVALVVLTVGAVAPTGKRKVQQEGRVEIPALSLCAGFSNLLKKVKLFFILFPHSPFDLLNLLVDIENVRANDIAPCACYFVGIRENV